MEGDKQFCAFLRLLIRSLEMIQEETDQDRQREMLRDLISNLQKTLED